MAASGNDGAKRMVLVGASNGKAWQFPKIGERTGLHGYQFDFLAEYDFDKSKPLSTLMQGTNKPDLVMIKECGAYFPGDDARYRTLLNDWVQALKREGIRPVMVTTAPVAAPASWSTRTKFWVKQTLGMSTAQGSIVAYNEWLRSYAKENNLPIFDLESILRQDDPQRWLRPEFNAGDGLHLSPAAYQAMDKAFVAFMAQQR